MNSPLSSAKFGTTRWTMIQQAASYGLNDWNRKYGSDLSVCHRGDRPEWHGLPPFLFAVFCSVQTPVVRWHDCRQRDQGVGVWSAGRS